ncbi:hypothetical protein [Brevundimonas sp. FT23042]|uniref:hypothetical protein n=1 Tax=Brevundimonas sp. FT23042 TaxID=3393749 RepID=UPI003B585D16
MTRALILPAVVAPLFLAGAAAAQSVPQPLPPAPSTWDQHRYQADQHRYEMERLRRQNEQRQAVARQLQLESRLTLDDLNRQRDMDPTTVPPPRLRSPEEARAARESATERRETTTRRVGEIDAWLDRRPN